MKNAKQTELYLQRSPYVTSGLGAPLDALDLMEKMRLREEKAATLEQIRRNLSPVSVSERAALKAEILGLQTKAQNYYLLFRKVLERQQPLEEEIKRLQRALEEEREARRLQVQQRFAASSKGPEDASPAAFKDETVSDETGPGDGKAAVVNVEFSVLLQSLLGMCRHLVPLFEREGQLYAEQTDPLSAFLFGCMQQTVNSVASSSHLHPAIQQARLELLAALRGKYKQNANYWHQQHEHQQQQQDQQQQHQQRKLSPEDASLGGGHGRGRTSLKVPSERNPEPLLPQWQLGLQQAPRRMQEGQEETGAAGRLPLAGVRRETAAKEERLSSLETRGNPSDARRALNGRRRTDAVKLDWRDGAVISEEHELLFSVRVSVLFSPSAAPYLSYFVASPLHLLVCSPFASSCLLLFPIASCLSLLSPFPSLSLLVCLPLSVFSSSPPLLLCFLLFTSSSRFVFFLFPALSPLACLFYYVSFPSLFFPLPLLLSFLLGFFFLGSSAPSSLSLLLCRCLPFFFCGPSSMSLLCLPARLSASVSLPLYLVFSVDSPSPCSPLCGSFSASFVFTLLSVALPFLFFFSSFVAFAVSPPALSLLPCSLWAVSSLYLPALLCLFRLASSFLSRLLRLCVSVSIVSPLLQVHLFSVASVSSFHLFSASPSPSLMFLFFSSLALSSLSFCLFFCVSSPLSPLWWSIQRDSSLLCPLRRRYVAAWPLCVSSARSSAPLLLCLLFSVCFALSFACLLLLASRFVPQSVSLVLYTSPRLLLSRQGPGNEGLTGAILACAGSVHAAAAAAAAARAAASAAAARGASRAACLRLLLLECVSAAAASGDEARRSSSPGRQSLLQRKACTAIGEKDVKAKARLTASKAPPAEEKETHAEAAANPKAVSRPALPRGFKSLCLLPPKRATQQQKGKSE
ncbi:hypothetical protein Efla_007807 [Eimeria flavescens]